MVPKLRSFWVNRVVILLVWDEWMTIIHSEHQWKLIGSVQRSRKYRHWTSRPSIIRELMRAFPRCHPVTWIKKFCSQANNALSEVLWAKSVFTYLKSSGLLRSIRWEGLFFCSTWYRRHANQKRHPGLLVLLSSRVYINPQIYFFLFYTGCNSGCINVTGWSKWTITSWRD